MKAFFPAAVFMVLLTGCRWMGDKGSSASSSACVRSLLPGESAAVEAGTRFTLSLVGNPTTGYCWEQSGAARATHIRLISEERRELDKKGRALCGAPSLSVFTFEAVSPGKERLVMVYKRPWEKKAPVKTEVFDIEIIKAR